MRQICSNATGNDFLKMVSVPLAKIRFHVICDCFSFGRNALFFLAGSLKAIFDSSVRVSGPGLDTECWSCWLLHTGRCLFQQGTGIV